MKLTKEVLALAPITKPITVILFPNGVRGFREYLDYMTKLTKPVQRSVDGLLAKPITVILFPHGVLGFREYRSRRVYTLPIITAYKWAIEAEREARRAAKKKARKRK